MKYFLINKSNIDNDERRNSFYFDNDDNDETYDCRYRRRISTSGVKSFNFVVKKVKKLTGTYEYYFFFLLML